MSPWKIERVCRRVGGLGDITTKADKRRADGVVSECQVGKAGRQKERERRSQKRQEKIRKARCSGRNDEDRGRVRDESVRERDRNAGCGRAGCWLGLGLRASGALALGIRA